MGKKRALPLLLLLGLAGTADAQALDEQAASTPFQISVNLDLVVLQAAVHDRKGQAVSDLREQDFEVYEDGVRQSLRLFRHEDIPVTVGLVVDHSGSMREKLADVIAAARTFVQSSSPEDQMFVVNFNDNVTLGLPEELRFTDRSDELARAIFNTPAIGQTRLYDAVFAAQRRLETGSREKKVLMVISDGGDNASKRNLAEVLKVAAKSSALIYTIGIFDDTDIDRNPAVLKRLAQATGGEAFFPREPGEVVAVCDRIARDIRNQYTLGYVSSNAAQPGTHRTIKVVARAAGKGNLVVRTRSGYTARGASQPAKQEAAK